MSKKSAKQGQQFVNEEYATDEECAELRRHLIDSGSIVPSDCSEEQEDKGIFPAPERNPNRRANILRIPDEGVWECFPIESDQEYQRRRQCYMHILQSVLLTRRELGVEFQGSKKDNAKNEG